MDISTAIERQKQQVNDDTSFVDIGGGEEQDESV